MTCSIPKESQVQQYFDRRLCGCFAGSELQDCMRLRTLACLKSRRAFLALQGRSRALAQLRLSVAHRLATILSTVFVAWITLSGIKRSPGDDRRQIRILFRSWRVSTEAVSMEARVYRRMCSGISQSWSMMTRISRSKRAAILELTRLGLTALGGLLLRNLFKLLRRAFYIQSTERARISRRVLLAFQRARRISHAIGIIKQSINRKLCLRVLLKLRQHPVCHTKESHRAVVLLKMDDLSILLTYIQAWRSFVNERFCSTPKGIHIIKIGSESEKSANNLQHYHQGKPRWFNECVTLSSLGTCFESRYESEKSANKLQHDHISKLKQFNECVTLSSLE